MCPAPIRRVGERRLATHAVGRGQALEAPRAIAQVGVIGIRVGRCCVPRLSAVVALTVTSPFASGIGKGRRIKPSATLNIAAFAPTPMAIDRMATSENPGFFASIRAPCRRSCQTVSSKRGPFADESATGPSSVVPSVNCSQRRFLRTNRSRQADDCSPVGRGVRSCSGQGRAGASPPRCVVIAQIVIDEP